MYLYDQTVGAGRDTGQGRRGNVLAVAGGVARVDDDRQMAQLTHNGNRRDIERVARVGLEGTDAALAQHHVARAVRQQVFGSHEPFLNRGRKTALQEYRHTDRTERFE